MLLYRQRSPLNGIETLQSRACFSTRDFANTHNLESPVGVAYFSVHRKARTNT
ncbi:putative PEBP-like superfamily protein [Helianthus anomalus]